MNLKMTLAVLVLSVGTLVVGADLTPDQLRDQGLEALRASQSDESKIIEAARLLAKASDGYERAGNESAATELNSYLYWCKKKMTLAQTEAFAKTGESDKSIAKKLDAVVTQKVESDDAEKWLENADAFAASHPNDLLLCAIRYFEVADRFLGGQESLVAQRRSLDLMKRATPNNAQKAPSSITGRWRVQYDSGDWRVIEIRGDCQVKILEAGPVAKFPDAPALSGYTYRIQIDEQSGKCFSVDLDLGRFETYELVGGKITIKRYGKKADYPTKVMKKATASRWKNGDELR